jgi:NADPH:quinone reductase-like Zn-dependent oxidoreductase
MSNQLNREIARNTKGEDILLIGSSGNIGVKALEILIKHGKASSITAFDKKEPKIKDLPGNIQV